MRFGAHLLIESSLAATAKLAHSIGCEALQIFAGNPRSWYPRDYTDTEIVDFKKEILKYEIFPIIIHMPYFINLGSPTVGMRKKSIDALLKLMRYADKVGAEFVVVHLGSSKDSPQRQGLIWAAESISETFGTSRTNCTLLLENSPGSGSELGVLIDDFARIISDLSSFDQRLGICLDTAHLWGAGYNISSEEGISSTLGQFNELVGIDKLKVVHANDTHKNLGSRNDKHTLPGHGQIGIKAFYSLLSYLEDQDVSIILETLRATPEENRHSLRILRNETSFGEPQLCKSDVPKQLKLF